MANSSKVTRQRCEVYSRVVGFIRPINQWNVGKQSEWEDRKYFKESV
jgi:ribonucleoside-triphosphate reductase